MTLQPVDTTRAFELLPQLLVEVGRLQQLIQSAMAGDESPIDQADVVASRKLRPHVTLAEQKVLVELCRPLLRPTRCAIPAANREIADQLVVSLACVKSHVRSLFAKFGVEDLPQNHKRAELAHRALHLGCVQSDDL